MRQSENRSSSVGRPALRDGRGGVRIAAAALAGAVSVIAGAFAAHGFDPVAQAKEIAWLRTGSEYQGLHALAVVTVAGVSDRLSPRWARLAQMLFLTGIVLFPAALYALALGGPRWFGAVAPIGGAAFILGWLAFAIAALRHRGVERTDRW